MDTDCCQLGDGLGNPVFFFFSPSGPRFPICRLKLGSFEGMGPEARRSARLALNRPVSAPVLQFQARDAGTQLQKSGTLVTLGTQVLAKDPLGPSE